MSVRAYMRVSTEFQSLDRQRNAIGQHIDQHYDVHISDVEYYRDKSTGTDTERNGYQQLMTDVQDGDTVVVQSIDRISRSVSDFSDTVDHFEQRGVTLDIIDEGITVGGDEDDPYQRAMVQILSALAELEAKMTRKRVQQGIAARQAADDDYKHGRAPIGLQKDDGHLAPADDFRHVQEMLLKVDQDEMSQREAASRLDCGRKTIRRHLRNSRELYELPPAEESQYLG